VTGGERDDEEDRRARNCLGKIHALSVVGQALAVSELDHAAAQLAADKPPRT
jgi:hypothetical protein